jgi:hypothetical protein
MDWKLAIRGCFGVEDRRFAEHPSDQRRAYELLGYLIEQNISMKEVADELRLFLAKNPLLHADEQIDRVREFYGIWLDG